MSILDNVDTIEGKLMSLHLQESTNTFTLDDPRQRPDLASLAQQQANKHREFYESYSRGEYPSASAPEKPDTYTDPFMLAPRPPPHWEKERQRHTYYTRLQRGDWKSDALKDSLQQQITLAQSLFKVSMAVASIITDEEWVNQSCTDNLRLLPVANREMTLCGHAILRRDRRPLVVLDAAVDWRFKELPQVKHNLLRFYAGIPLISTVRNLTTNSTTVKEEVGEEFPIGTLCIFSSSPRQVFTNEEELLLRNLGDTIMSLVDYHLCNAHVHEQQIRTQCLADFAKLPLQQTNQSDFTVAMKSRFSDINEMMTEGCTQIQNCFQGVASCKMITEQLTLNDFRFHCESKSLEHLTVAVYETLDCCTGAGSDIHGYLVLYGNSPQQVFNQNDRNFLVTFSTAMTAFLQEKVIQRTNQAKTQFLNSMSHEIRTPLHGLSAMTDLLMENDNITPEMMNLLTLMQTSSRAIQTVVSNIFAFRDLETTTMIDRGVVEAINLDQTMQEILDGHASIMKSHVELYFENQLPLRMTHATVNVELFRSICNQLITNASKFTDQGYVKVILRKRGIKRDYPPESDAPTSTYHNRMFIECLIKDTGRGISSEFVQNGLFTPFCKEDPYTQGVGLGLNLSTKYAQALHHAKVELVSTCPEKGSLFALTFQIDQIEEAGNEDQEDGDGYIDEHERWLYLKREMAPIIYLNDEQHAEKTTSSWKNFYHTFYEFTTSATAASIHSTSRFAVHLLETRTLIDPDSSGDHSAQKRKPVSFSFIEREAVRLAQRYTDNGNGCVLIIVSIADMIQFAALTEKYANLYIISAPFGRTRVNHVLYKALNSAHLKQKERKFKEIHRLRQQRELQASPQHIAAYEARDIFALVVDDNSININILSTFLRKREVRHLTALDGDEAVELFKAHKGRINLILMDIQMKRMNGLEAVALIRQHEQQQVDWTPAKIAMLTGLADTQSREESMRMGASSYFSKPIRIKDIDIILKDWFGTRQ